jgi:hypothetical protein
VSVIDLLGFVIFLTVVTIGLLDARSGLTVLAMYRSAGLTDLHRQRPTEESRGGGNQPLPPTPAA